MNTSNAIKFYDIIVKNIKKSPSDPELQHQAVLALARAGSLDFALSEYLRYGLDKIRHHEDIMALGGRLYKDLFLANSGDVAKEHAFKSSEIYEAAYKDTDGYYSGINAGTMALVAGVPIEIVQGRAQAILRELPNIEELSKVELYFIEATRAEAYLLLGDDAEAETALRNAIEHDPLNYTAHASTLKQFHMICEHRTASCDWLVQFLPPKPAHYSGHMFLTAGAIAQGEMVSDTEENNLRVEISDAIQRHDIGFGFGALAAGSDILIAETLLEEGCALHVVLPVGVDLFIEHSVAPFGTAWVERFHNCVKKADSFSTVIPNAEWPSSNIDEFSRSIAMGHAIMRADVLSVEPIQLLLWDGAQEGNWTAQVAAEWAVYGRTQCIIPYLEPRTRKAALPGEFDKEGCAIQIMLCNADNSKNTVFDNLNEAVLSALDLQRSGDAQSRIGIHMGIAQDNDEVADISGMLSNHAVPNSILVSDAVASRLALHCRDLFSTDYIGQVKFHEKGIRAFALKTKGKHVTAT